MTLDSSFIVRCWDGPTNFACSAFPNTFFIPNTETTITIDANIDHTILCCQIRRCCSIPVEPRATRWAVAQLEAR